MSLPSDEAPPELAQVRDFWQANPCGSNFIDGEPTREFFEEYDQFRFSTLGHIREEFDRVDFRGKRVLEIGLGQGADSLELVRRGALYNGIDLTEESVRRVRQRFALYDAPYESVAVASALDIPFPDHSFDFVYTHGVLHHTPEIEKTVAEVHRVLKPGGQAIVMLYNRDSFNYYVSIGLIRRVGLLCLVAAPSLTPVVSRLTGEGEERIRKHLVNFKNEGWSYLSMKKFVHRSTDGPDNVWATTWNKQSAKSLFRAFSSIETRVHFLNERHLLGLQRFLPASVKDRIARRYGWNLWIYATK